MADVNEHAAVVVSQWTTSRLVRLRVAGGLPGVASRIAGPDKSPMHSRILMGQDIEIEFFWPHR
jgi:hypothetical protein